MSDRPTSKAFTLIEMLIALALISLIVTMVYGSYAATSQSLEVYNSRMACCERGHLVLRLMARQLRCAYMPLSQTQAAHTAADRDGTQIARPVTFRAEPFEPAGEILDFTTTGGFGGSTTVSRIKYRYDRSEGVLYIHCGPLSQAVDNSRDPEGWRPVLRGITSLELAFHDGRLWQPAWDSREAGRLPQAARVAFTITDESGRDHLYRTTAPIVCRATPGQRENHIRTGQR